MSLYKNIGPITFLSETQNVQIFWTLQYYVIQIKNWNSGCQPNPVANRIKILEKFVQKIQQKFENNNCIKVYEQDQKPPSLLINRNYIEVWNFQGKNNIQNLCAVCQSMLNSLQVCNGMKVHGKLQKNMFFINLENDSKFYLSIDKLRPAEEEIDVSQKQEEQNVYHILQFLNQNFNAENDISYKLLLNKLKKCKTLCSMQQQIQYFQRVYEVGATKLYKYKPQNGCVENKLISYKKNQRQYRKISEQREQCENKKQTSSSHLSHRENFQKRTINLLGIGKCQGSQSIDIFGNSHYKQNSNFATRNKSSNAIHAGSKSLRYNQNTLRSSKGLFKSNSKSKYNLFGSTTNSFHKTAELSNYFYNTATTNKFQNQRVIKQNTRSKHIDNKRKVVEQKMGRKQFSIVTQSPSSNNDIIVNQLAINQLVNRNLKKWKEKINKQTKQTNTKNIRQIVTKEGQKQKSLKRKAKPYGVELSSVANLKSIGTDSSTPSLKNVQQYEIQLSKEFNFATSITRLENKKTDAIFQLDQMVQPTNIKACNKQSVVHELQLSGVQKQGRSEKQAKLAINDLKKEKQNIVKKIYEQAIEEIAFINRDEVETQRQRNQVKKNKNQSHPCSKNIKQKSSENEKQKTIRKNEQANLSKWMKSSTKQLIAIQKQIDKINFVGECVTKVPEAISKIEKQTGNKYLWQLPAFLLYKEFYFQRLNIIDNLKQTLLHNTQDNKKSDQLVRYVKQFQDQNNEAKQSLLKLVKIASKKLKQYQIDAKTLEVAKACLNINETIRIANMRRLNEISLDFISEIDEVRQSFPEIAYFQIELVDAYLITRGTQFSIQQRNQIQTRRNEEHVTSNYLKKRLTLCGI